MVVGRHKHLMKVAKKEPRRKWPIPTFSVRRTGRTRVTQTQGTKTASDDPRGHVFEVSLAAERTFELITKNVPGTNCLTILFGMHLTCNKMCSMHLGVCQIWKMIEIMTREVQMNDLKVLNKMIPHSTGKGIKEACKSIYPSHGVFVWKKKTTC
ncbi:hypothetical protein HPG69_008503 [Diceros bicornis minor]|uniref:Uncharacterized protein n=1 Tax=Diceros bicornis minor TaxID=77932 RepID=A0A7J7FKY4_DICBM|nr:hypothetical protein HPG69_008503 [Diceros bicornis minor]